MHTAEIPTHWKVENLPKIKPTHKGVTLKGKHYWFVIDEYELWPKKAKQVVDNYLKRALEVHVGRNRATVVLNDRFVVKIPLSGAGISDNDWEGSIVGGVHSTKRGNVQYPVTRWLDVQGIIFVYMQYVNEVIDMAAFKLLPSWVDCVDCGQVGYTRQGRLVAFDYGYN